MSTDYDPVEKSLAAAGIEPCPPDCGPSAVQIEAVETRLGFPLPPSFVWFLKTYGGAELLGDEVYSFYGKVVDGRYEFDPELDVGDVVHQRESCVADGSVGDTALPVMATDYGELFYLDSSRSGVDGGYPVVVLRGRNAEDYAPDFAAFLRRYLAGNQR